MLIRFIKKEFFLFSLIVLTLFLTLFHINEIKNYPGFIDWRTVIALTGLLIITTGLKESGYFHILSKRILKKIRNERGLAFFFIILSTLLSPFLTNDITLFIVIPLTLSLKSFIKNDISKLIIFEAISVNIGSSLTPIGNPQNLFLWHKWNISFGNFILKMFPLFLVLFTVIVIFSLIFFHKRKIDFAEKIIIRKNLKKNLLYISLLFLIVYLISLELKRPHYVLIFIFIVYFLFYKKALIKTDWLLLFTFILIFIDFHIISTIPLIGNYINSFNLGVGKNVFLLSAISSQIISNVPASVFVSKFSHNWFSIAYGVNVAGNGFIIASLANLIALRMVKIKGIWMDFHKYSILYFIITIAISYFLFF